MKNIEKPYVFFFLIGDKLDEHPCNKCIFQCHLGVEVIPWVS